jgi:hypothetical protein
VAGTHSIQQGTLAASALGYNVVYGNGNLTVNMAALTANADAKSKTYGAAEPGLTYTVGGTLFYGDTAGVVSGVSLSTPTGASATAGSHTITATGGTASNYTVTPVNGTLTVNKAPLVMVADDKSKVYGASEPVLTASTAAGQLKYSDTLSVVTSLSLTTATGAAATAGTHAITGTGSAANYAISVTSGTLSVSKAPLTITADNKTRTYGDAEPVLSYSGNPLQLKYSDSLSVVSAVALSAPTGSAATAGTHSIVASGGTALNYAITTANGTLTVDKATVTVAADGKSRPVGEANPPFTATLSGFRYGQSAADLGGALRFSTAAGIGSPVGNYLIEPAGYSAANYSFNFVPGTLSVTNVQAATTSTINNSTDASGASLLFVLQPVVGSFGSASVQVNFAPSGIGFLNRLPATAAGAGGAAGSGAGDSDAGSAQPVAVSASRPRTVMRSNCGSQPMQMLNCR